nr:efflux RND transporter periplasmic adaptor subunit [Pseudoxanthomonas suwonensis]
MTLHTDNHETGNTLRSAPRLAPRLLVLATGVAMAVAVLAGCSGGQASEQHAPPPQVGVAEVPVQPVQQWDEFSGRIEAIESVDLRPRVSGYIEQVNYREGQEVKKGDVLFTIDARSYRAELDRAEAALARAQAQAGLARSEAERARRLSEEQAISQETYEQRRAAAAQAQSDLAAARAAVETARLNLEWTKVRSPIDGRAGRALVTAGNLVVAGDASSVLTTVVSLDRVHVHFDADERSFLRYAELARSGKRASERDGTLPVQVALADEQGFPHAGTIDFLDNQVDRSTGTIRARAVLDNADRRFTPGLYARVRLPGSGRFEAALVDDKAVLTDQDRKYVYVVDGEGKAQRRDIVLGRLTEVDGEPLRIVQSGLEAGDKVIVSGVQKVFFPGMPVQPQAVAMTAKARTADAVARR